MNNKIKITILSIITIFIVFLILFPFIEFKKDNYIYMFSYAKELIESEDFETLEDELCFDESYTYNKKRNISLNNYEYKNFLFFRYLKAKYIEGNICKEEYILKTEYINHFIKNAEIIKNEDNIDLKELIKDKTPIVKNKKYPWNEDYKLIEYKLDGKNMSMYIYTTDKNLLVIQVGLSDEGPKYIAYK